jgi:CHAD domain-containing protein
LGAVRAVSDGAAAHAARIEAKRLRYVLEPFRSAIPGAEELIGRLKQLQNQLGRFQDLRTLADEMRVAAADEAAARAARLFDRALARPAAEGPLPARRTSDAGLVAVAALVRAEQDQVFHEIDNRWLGDHAGEVSRDAERLAAEIAGRTAEVPRAAAPRRARTTARRARSRGPRAS